MGTWWASWASNPRYGANNVVGRFDSDALPPFSPPERSASALLLFLRLTRNPDLDAIEEYGSDPLPRRRPFETAITGVDPFLDLGREGADEIGGPRPEVGPQGAIGIAQRSALFVLFETVLELSAVSLPLTVGALELGSAGIVSGGSGRNRQHLADSVAIDETIPEEIVTLAFDSETSGGLLIAVAEEKSEALVTALRNEGTPCAQDVGRVVDRDPGSGLKLRLTP